MKRVISKIMYYMNKTLIFAGLFVAFALIPLSAYATSQPYYYDCVQTPYLCETPVLYPAPQPYVRPTPLPPPAPAPEILPTVNLNANPVNILSGQSSTLTWSSANASYCYAYGAWSGNKNLAGSEVVYPSSTRTYTITCTNNSGSVSASQTIYVSQPYVQPGFGTACSVSPVYPRVGNTVTFSAVQSGGIAPYTYNWSGNVYGNNQTVSSTFNTTGVKTATITIRDYSGRTATGSCSVNILSAAKAVVVVAKPKPVQKCKTVTVCIDETDVVNQCAQSSVAGKTPTPTPTEAATPTPTPTIAVNTAATSSTFLASLANVFKRSDGTSSFFKTLIKWYLIIIGAVLLIGLVFLLIRRATGKEVR